MRTCIVRMSGAVRGGEGMDGRGDVRVTIRGGHHTTHIHKHVCMHSSHVWCGVWWRRDGWKRDCELQYEKEMI